MGLTQRERAVRQCEDKIRRPDSFRPYSEFCRSAWRPGCGVEPHVRYLRKDIDKCGILFSINDVESLAKNEALTPFQRVSIKAAFHEGSPTRQLIIGLNSKARLEKVKAVREKYDKSDH